MKPCRPSRKNGIATTVETAKVAIKSHTLLIFTAPGASPSLAKIAEELLAISLRKTHRQRVNARLY